MRRLRLFFIFLLSWALVSSMLIACSKDKGGGKAPVACPHGYTSSGGTCIPTVPTNGYPPPGTGGFSPNGSVQNDDNFRDFTFRLFGYQYYCGSAGGYFNCHDAQLKLQKIDENNYRVYLTTPSIRTGSVVLNGRKFSYSGRPGFYLEVYYGNPYPYKIAEVDVTQNLDQTAVPYYLSYFRNANQTTTVPIVSGTMRKGIDY